MIPSLEESLTIKEFFFDKNKNINGLSKIYNDLAIFKDGSGYWKDFYNQGQIKEKGDVEDNYKTGKWQYYNELGEIDSVKVYSVKDSVDIRFPYCLFNKKEPCY